jgi:CysZ protein
MNVIGALGYGLINAFHPRMLWLMVWPMLVALVIWGVAALLLWTRLAVSLAAILKQWLEPALGFIRLDFGDATLIAAHVILFLLFVPLVYVTALFILGIFGMQKMVDYVAERSFPQLERRRGGSMGGSLGNGLAALGGMLGLFLLSLPLWLIPPLWPLIPLALLTWGNQRLLRYDALAEHADKVEMARIFRSRRGGLYTLGFLLALLAFVPLVQFLGPVVFGLAFIRYVLAALIELRYGGHPNKELAAGNAPP